MTIEDYSLQDGSTACVLPLLRPITLALGVVIIAAALLIVGINRLRVW